MEIKLNEYWKLVGEFPKDMEAEAFLAMIESVRSVVRQQMPKTTVPHQRINHHSAQNENGLTVREQTVFDMIKAGKSPDEIAVAMKVDRQNVYSARSQLRRKGHNI